ncbi:MAG: PAS domain S-box protein [Ignavibacteriaceae bacterium]|nr:PAS domain S-box protein [Ignavibacteriaceae bacterium]
MPLKKLFRFLLGIQFVLGIGLVILTLLLFLTQKDLSESQHVHFQSYLLADELRQSSDDLTRMARAYAITGDVEFEKKYWEILAIRNGKSPRPVNYNRIYWDFVIATGQKPRTDSEALSLHDLMLKEGFTKAEFEKLALAQKNSDGLVKTEMIAMNAVKGLFDDGSGNFTLKKKPDREMAIRIMNDEAYHKIKAEIMKPIDEFYAMFDERTTGDVRIYERHAMNLLWSLGVLILTIMGMFGYSFVIIQRQINKRMQAEESLSKSEKQFRALFENASDGIIYLSSKNQIVKTNNSFAKMHGYTVDEMNNITLQDLDVEDLSKLMPERTKRIVNGEDIRFEVQHFHKEGHIIDLEVVTSMVNFGEENLIVAFHRDITERKRAEEKLRMYEQVFNSINDVINVADLNDAIVFVNPAFCKTYGYTEAELIGKNSSLFWSERNPKEVVEQILPATLNGGWKGELFNKRKDGTEFPIYLSTSVIKNDAGEQIAVVGIVEDITERKREDLERQVMHEITKGVTTTSNLDELLKLIHQSLKQVLYAENIFIALHDPNTGLFSFPYFVDKFDPTPEPVAMSKSCTAYVFRMGKPLLLTQELFDQLEKRNEVELVGTNSPSWIGIPLQTPSMTIGVLILQHYEEENVYSEQDVKFLESVGSQIALAIERKRAEDELKESEEMFRRLFDESNDPILLLDETGFFDCNPSTVSLLGYTSKEEFLNKKPWELSPEKQPDGQLSSLKAKMMIDKAIAEGYNRFEWIHTKLDGSDVPVEVMLTPIQLKGKQILYTIWRDIAERKRAEVEIKKQNEQLEELNATKDKFFSIIAHDLRSPFQGFLSMTEMIAENISEFSNEDIVKFIGELNKSARNLYKLLQNLLDWAQLKKGSFDFTPAEFSLSATVSANIEQINKRAIQKGISIVNEVSENQKIFVDERMFNSVLGNLLSNAVKFTRNEGKVTIKSKTVGNGIVEIAVEDSGVGMSERTLNKLFKIDEKVGQKGTDGETSTGLGLLLCKEFVEKHGGKIWVESEEGKGSIFHVTIAGKN